VLSPKRKEASDLSEQVATLQSQVAQDEAAASTAGVAKNDFKSNYRQLITLGKAVPVDADTPSLLTQLETLSSRSDVAFQGITLGGSGGGGVPAAAPTTSVTGETLATGEATEASASLLPIGASVGAAGLPIMPYTMDFNGGFFDIADFFGEVDAMVNVKGTDKVSVDGRLLTINNFTMAPLEGEGQDLVLEVTVDATSYLSPADQGLTGGATPTGPLATPVPAAESTTTQPATPAVVGQ
jgi:Tfp pilus assembly protein PilO